MRRLSKACKEIKALFKWISGVGSFQAEGAAIDKVLRMMCPTQSRKSGDRGLWTIVSTLAYNSRRSEAMELLKVIANKLGFTPKLGVTAQY